MRSRLTRAVVEVERHAAAAGWDQPPRLFALVETAELLRHEPQLARSTGLPEQPAPGELTPVEQEALPTDRPLDEVLAHLAWPEEVSGCALVVEQLMLPPEAEADLPDEASALGAWVAAHPQRQDVRIAVGVLRDGTRESAVRMRSHDRDDEVLSGPDLVPRLADALAATLLPD